MKQRVQRLYRMILGGGILIPLLVGCTKRQQPNIIVIMCDDLGYNDVGCYGQQLIETPNIDRMAREGMRFTQAYAGSPVSAPSRASFMTGQHSGHTEVRGNKEYWRYADTIYYGDNPDYARVGQHPYAELVQPQDSLVRHYEEKFSEDCDWESPHWSRYNTSPNAVSK